MPPVDPVPMPSPQPEGDQPGAYDDADGFEVLPVGSKCDPKDTGDSSAPTVLGATCSDVTVRRRYGDRVLDANVEPRAAVLDAATGDEVWASGRPCASDTSPVVDSATGRVFFSCDASGDQPPGLLAYDGYARCAQALTVTPCCNSDSLLYITLPPGVVQPYLDGLMLTDWSSCGACQVSVFSTQMTWSQVWQRLSWRHHNSVITVMLALLICTCCLCPLHVRH